MWHDAAACRSVYCTALHTRRMKPTNHMSQPHAIQQHLRPARCSHMRSEAIYDTILCGQSHHSLKAYTSTNMYHIPHKYAFVLALNTQFIFYRVQCIVHTRWRSAAIATVLFWFTHPYVSGTPHRTWTIYVMLIQPSQINPFPLPIVTRHWEWWLSIYYLYWLIIKSRHNYVYHYHHSSIRSLFIDLLNHI